MKKCLKHWVKIQRLNYGVHETCKKQIRTKALTSTLRASLRVSSSVLHRSCEAAVG